MVIRFFSLVLICLSMFFSLGCKNGLFGLKKSVPPLRLAPQIGSGKLSNGVGYYFLKSTKPEKRCFIRLNVAIGSFVEKDHELGMAHFLEHLAFDDRAVSKEYSLAEWFQKHGMSFGPDANAYTAPDRTVYKIDLPSCDPQALKDALAIMRSFADGLKFNNETLIKEQGVVSAEELETKNSPAQLSEKIIKNLYSGTLYTTRPVLGKVDKRALFTSDMLNNFYHQWYHPKNLSVVLVGDYGEEDPVLLIEDAFHDLVAKEKYVSGPSGGKLDYKRPAFVLYEKNLVHEDIIFSVQPKKITKPKFALSLLKDRLAFELAIAMLKNSFAKQARHTAGVVRENNIEGFMLDEDIYELSLSTAASIENFEQNFLDAFAIVRSSAEFGFGLEEFQAARNIYLDYIDMTLVQESTWGSDNWTNLILDHIGNRRFAYSAEDYRNWVRPLLAELSAKDCSKALSKALKSGYQFIFGIGPLQETSENITKIHELLKRAYTQKINALASTPPVNFAYKVPNCSVIHVAPRVFLPNIGAYRIAVSKNLNVLVKPTDFKHDEILLAIFTNEGFLTMDARDLTRAHMAQIVLPEGGLGQHAPEQMINLLKDKFFTMKLAVLDDRTQATISTRSEDLRFTLELLRAVIFDPLYAESALSRIKEELKINYAELKHHMWWPLQNDFPRDLSAQDHRVGQDKLNDLLSLSRDDLLLWHKKYLSSRPLDIVIVGDVDVDEVMNTITCVLAPVLEHAPVAKKKNSAKIRFKSGLHREYHVDTDDDASKVVLRYPLMFPSHVYPDHRLPIMQNIIQEGLRMKLREKKHTSYAPSATVTMSRDPRAQNWIDIVVSSPQEDANNLLKETKKIIDNLARKGVSAHQLSKAKEPYLAQISTMFYENEYWLFSLAQSFDRADKLPGLKRVIADIKAIDAQAINDLLRTYMRTDKASSAIVHGNKVDKKVNKK